LTDTDEGDFSRADVLAERLGADAEQAGGLVRLEEGRHDVIRLQGWLLHLRRKGVSVLLVHHAGRSDNARGTSKREDVLDTVIYLKRPDDYDPEEGARCEVHLTKARGTFGDDALPFEARLDVIDGRDCWTCTILQDREKEQVLDLTRQEMTVRDIAAETGLSKSRVNRRLWCTDRADGAEGWATVGD
jgi:hypothetical protein